MGQPVWASWAAIEKCSHIVMQIYCWAGGGRVRWNHYSMLLHIISGGNWAHGIWISKALGSITFHSVKCPSQNENILLKISFKNHNGISKFTSQTMTFMIWGVLHTDSCWQCSHRFMIWGVLQLIAVGSVHTDLWYGVCYILIAVGSVHTDLWYGVCYILIAVGSVHTDLWYGVCYNW